MKKVKSLISMFLILCILSATIINVNAYSPESEQCGNASYCDSGVDNLYMDSDKVHFLSQEKIVVTYRTNSDKYIKDITYDSVGFDVVSAVVNENDSKQIVLELSCQSNAESYFLFVNAILSDDNVASSDLYAAYNNHGTFLSTHSEEDAADRYLYYLLTNKLITSDEYESVKEKNFNKFVSESFEISQKNDTVDLYAVRPTVYVTCEITWVDNSGVSHPLRSAKVDIYKVTSSGNTKLASTKTNNYGKCSAELNNVSASASIFARVYADDGNVTVIDTATNAVYYFESERYSGITSNSLCTLTKSINMNGKTGQGFQIHQAAITARDYAKDMIGSTPPAVTALYPKESEIGGCAYYYDTNEIYIGGDANGALQVYESWDIIMHEYGHHIQWYKGIYEFVDAPNGHTSNTNHVLEFGKEDGIKLAWAEAWPTVFGIIAQQYCSYISSNIATVKDEVYSAYNLTTSYNLNTTSVKKGEACEQSIMAVLWDIYDSDTESIDSFALGAEAWWDLSAENGATTFYMFVQDFYQTYQNPTTTLQLGKLLTHYNMSGRIESVQRGTSSSDPARVVCSRQGSDTDGYMNNMFCFVVFDSDMRLVLTTGYMTVTASSTAFSYTFSESEWSTIINSCGSQYVVSVIACETSSPVTGYYYSEGYTASIPN